MAEIPLAQQIGVERVRDNEYVSTACPAHLGNARPIAYGGNTIALAIHAACKTVSPVLSLYSALGHFLGPAQIDRHVYARVSHLRDTKTFATRQVTLHQVLDDGAERRCLVLLADFHRGEPTSTSFSPPLFAKYARPEQYPSPDQLHTALAAQGKLNEKTWRIFYSVLGYQSSFFEQRLCTEGVSGQNLSGIAKTVQTTCDHLDLTQKTSAEWLRAQHPLCSHAEQVSALGFLMDDGLALLPLAHDHRFIDEVAVASSLEFALRVFSSSFDLNRWHIRERKTTAANAGRTYSEAKLWDEEGKIVAEMTQQCIIRARLPEERIFGVEITVMASISSGFM
ncbi:hypothetical protein LTR20_007377 [Exophiala xenobiotica]|nr:hypothetical protein LTS06_008028 [Exophiala xenobiotica]KAK5283490.1 hypothetical protein LTR40_001633 [Exophiala xenobiotica]KAK5367231.1 hypothetical protein LTS13_008084 [Exophiala xenobiotica]KAK5401240.1 hypothetical protein LTR79_001759 [Exophiala xenobiotica]KAK5405943.1 hypothetical protein LTR90_010754 [Exophiala xenobiotica]